MSMSNFNSILRPTTQPNHDISNILTNTKPNPRVIPSNSMNNLNFFKKTLPHSEFSNNLVISSLLQNHLNDIP